LLFLGKQTQLKVSSVYYICTNLAVSIPLNKVEFDRSIYLKKQFFLNATCNNLVPKKNDDENRLILKFNFWNKAHNYMYV